jgi:regulatory protein
MAMAKNNRRRAPVPVDAKALEALALAYAGRYATTRRRLADYLTRKLRERGWAGVGEPPVAALIEKMGGLGYVDDRAFATAKAASLGRRGYGEKRIGSALKAAGIAEEDGADALAEARDGAWGAALRYAERRRIGPFAAEEGDRGAREKAFAAMVRAGHPPALARRLAAAAPGEIPDADSF